MCCDWDCLMKTYSGENYILHIIGEHLRRGPENQLKCELCNAQFETGVLLVDHHIASHTISDVE